MPPEESLSIERLQGEVERITFHNPENGFCVLRTKVKGHRNLVTIVGNAATIAVGECVECRGIWINDKKHGLQFKAEQLQVIPPTTKEGIQKYLGSGMIKGIGPHFAKQLVLAFGEQVFEIIENEPARLIEVNGMGEKRREDIVKAWKEQKSIRDIMIFLQSHGIGTNRAVRIFKKYGDKAILQVSENPYRLAADIHGIGFKTADALALRLGISSTSLIRAEAGVHYVLQDLCDDGHCAIPKQELIENSIILLGIEKSIIEEAIQKEIGNRRLIEEKVNEVECIFPPALHYAENAVADYLQIILKGSPPWGEINIEKAIPWVEEKTALQLAQSQRKAIEIILNHKISIVTGGPGVGKTTIVKVIIKILQAKKMAIALCAPTGRAAKRLSESTGLPAKTIHRMLNMEVSSNTFKHHQNNPLPINVLIIDEVSMIDIVLFYHLLKALPPEAALLLIGDVDQLPSVGPGALLLDLIHSQTIPIVRLTEIFRQAAGSRIIVNAHRINQGEMPLPEFEGQSDFFTIYSDKSDTLQEQLINLVVHQLPQKNKCNAISDIQVLTPMNRGSLGTVALNIALQKILNGQAEPKVTHYGMTFSPGDKVIQLVNNYNKEVYNGDIGRILHIHLDEKKVKIAFDTHSVEYDLHELDEISLAYAISIHKSQGSEFPIVVIPVAMQHYMLLLRNLLYTGVTRGKQLVILLGEKKAIGMAVKNNSDHSRLTKLSERLKERLLTETHLTIKGASYV